MKRDWQKETQMSLDEFRWIPADATEKNGFVASVSVSVRYSSPQVTKSALLPIFWAGLKPDEAGLKPDEAGFDPVGSVMRTSLMNPQKL